MRRWTLRLALMSSCSIGCAQTSQILPARDRSYSVAEPGEVVVWCKVPEDAGKLEKCKLRLEERDGIVPHELRTKPVTP